MKLSAKKIIESALPENQEFLEFMYQDNFFENLKNEELPFCVKNLFIATHIALESLTYTGIEEAYITMEYKLFFISDKDGNGSKERAELTIGGELRIKDRFKLAEIDRPWTAGSTASLEIRSSSHKNVYVKYLKDAREQTECPANPDMDRFLNSGEFKKMSISANKHNINKMVDHIFSGHEFLSPQVLDFFITKKLKDTPIILEPDTSDNLPKVFKL